jgi:hypothetical protein
MQMRNQRLEKLRNTKLHVFQGRENFDNFSGEFLRTYNKALDNRHSQLCLDISGDKQSSQKHENPVFTVQSLLKSPKVSVNLNKTQGHIYQPIIAKQSRNKDQQNASMLLNTTEDSVDLVSLLGNSVVNFTRHRLI